MAKMPDSDFEVHSLAKSCNEVLLLAILTDGPRHGYQLAVEIEERSEGFFRFNHGTLYPILHKLEKDGMIRGIWSEQGPRRRRKSYTLTRQGRKYLGDRVRSWGRFFEHFEDLVGELKS
jgi:DNA-binding PadR family transcriptional regulator